MKTKLCKLALFSVTIAIILLSVTACFGRVIHEGNCLVLIESIGGGVKTYDITLPDVLGDEGLFSLLEYLAESEGLHLKTSVGPYGKMLLEVGELIPDSGKNQYIKIFTSVEEDFDVGSLYMETMEYGGRTLCTSGLGASQMRILPEQIYYIKLGSY